MTAFVDWKAQIHNARATGITEPRNKAGQTLKNVARIVEKVLIGRAPSVRFLVAFRFYHGWHKGFEATENRKVMIGLVAETDFTNLTSNPNVRFLEEVRYGDELLTAFPQRSSFLMLASRRIATIDLMDAKKARNRPLRPALQAKNIEIDRAKSIGCSFSGGH